MQEHGGTAEFEVPVESGSPGWLEEAREMLSPSGRYLVCRDKGEILTFAVEPGWARIGRSVAAHIRLDDPSVSRRHALIVSEQNEPLRVLDDRSLNGVLVNGDPIEWGTLDEGDELTIGRYRLFVLEG